MPLRPFLAALALIGLAACAPREPQPMADFDPHARFRNVVEKQAAVAVVAPTAQGGIGADDRAALADLAREHARRGAGPVAVRIGHGGDEAAARAFADRVAEALAAEGVDAVTVAFAPQPGAETVAAQVSVPVWVAQVPTCGQWGERISPDFRNQNTDNFGCAVTRNIGLMVANPADLERARGASGRSGARAEDVLTKYGTGKATSSKAEDSKPSASLSDVGTGQ